MQKSKSCTVFLSSVCLFVMMLVRHSVWNRCSGLTPCCHYVWSFPEAVENFNLESVFLKLKLFFSLHNCLLYKLTSQSVAGGPCIYFFQNEEFAQGGVGF